MSDSHLHHAERADALFQEGFSCSQSVFAAFAPELGLDSRSALAIAAPFGSGMARLGEVCGALTGGYMALGLRHPRLRAADEAAREKVYAALRELSERFRGEFGHLRCRDLLGFDLGDPDQAAQAKAQGLFADRCPAFVHFVAAWLDQHLQKSD